MSENYKTTNSIRILQEQEEPNGELFDFHLEHVADNGAKAVGLENQDASPAS